MAVVEALTSFRPMNRAAASHADTEWIGSQPLSAHVPLDTLRYQTAGGAAGRSTSARSGAGGCGVVLRTEVKRWAAAADVVGGRVVVDVVTVEVGSGCLYAQSCSRVPSTDRVVPMPLLAGSVPNHKTSLLSAELLK
mmetsp:Transcript_22650/g.61815  ORF Transcript_22650/g.61815 Transcript_22650/m.61815 type:complete len:137 (-) Transcript_22650:117-527(-)